MHTIKLLDDGTVIGDPCHIIRNKHAYDEFLVATQKIDLPLDTGTVMKVREEDFLKLRKPTPSAAAKARFARLQKTREN
jgi:hypothetical protein